MKFESFTGEEPEVPIVEEMENVEHEPIAENLPEEAVGELFSGAYNETLKEKELPDIAKEHMEEQKNMITNEAKGLEAPSVMSKLGHRAKRNIIIGVTLLSIMAGSMIKPEMAEAKKGFDWGNLKYNMSKFFVKDTIKEKIKAAKEKEKNAVTPAEKSKYRLQAEFWKYFGKESEQGLKEGRNQEIRKEREKEQEKRRKERIKEQKQRKAERDRAAAERKAVREAERKARQK